ncbi:hypothetical protein MUS1_06825 [Marinomonas ushuaiensis DSM 15871]|uniref:Uncharacterized protein n=1 Tax=Marinomonas ushuaiensis DSM 15871 TaxID=1122207 RepID=X7E303_9GAMM|nr:hypothetical protein MUS1_06825 [Marinomonas ushuaiensis DSM 15871]
MCIFELGSCLQNANQLASTVCQIAMGLKFTHKKSKGFLTYPTFINIQATSYSLHLLVQCISIDHHQLDHLRQVNQFEKEE